ncbi:Na+/H+ antiporter subunit E [Oceanobacillus piezotolerans]|uniref:Na+/H+ antiporter subunit E n=1 Tax=Oceanobacillus piezotolerans TaxID=2448030 RepID=A0A498D3G8_9BACI|nr:Na+/H+ antiporter subunit E [Oceanobacillus piezotolerans]RLL42722.1 Na+/H+ antiporter subunit E [Oceanobacillus piezotolerans]
MPAQFLVNIFIAFLWVLFQDEDQFYITTFVTGFLVGIGILYVLHRFFGERFYLTRVVSIIKLISLFISELCQSSIQVLKLILSPKIEVTPGIIRYEINVRGEWEVPLLALLLILTPGSVVVEVTPEGDAFYIHAIDVTESREKLIKSLGKYERAIMEVTR